MRSFGFSVAEIHELLSAPQSYTRILPAVCQRKRRMITGEQAVLSVLEQLEHESFDSAAQLAAALSAIEKNPSLPADGSCPTKRCLIIRALRVLLLTMTAALPLLFLILHFYYIYHLYQYHKKNIYDLLYILLTLPPTIIISLLFLRKKKPNVSRWISKATIILCVLLLPVSFIFSCRILGPSETSDIHNYWKLDAGCVANRSGIFQELFPTWPATWSETDAAYYYYYLSGVDYTYDIYAEWPLSEKEFDAELERVTALFTKQDDSWQKATLKTAHYTCMFCYSGDPPFSSVSNSYTYYIFAYDTKTHRVRYLLCDSLENGCDQPYYPKIDW